MTLKPQLNSYKSKTTDSINAYYSQWWGNPADSRDLIFQRLYRYLEKRLPPGRGKKALDIGAGKGAIVSLLLKKGYMVTALDINQGFLEEIKRKSPEVRIIHGKIEEVPLMDHYDVITMIELIQNLTPEIVPKVLRKVSTHTKFLLTDISNRNSFHGAWVEFRKFRNDFVHPYTPTYIHKWLKASGFRIKHRRGIGLLTPVTLRQGFRIPLIPAGLAKWVNQLELFFPRHCHIYYLEAEVNGQN